MIIGDTMEDRVSLIDMNFENFSKEKKREAFVLMDLMLKRMHDSNLMVQNIDPKKIIYQDGFYYFENVSPISNYNSENKDEAILKNVLGLANLALCSYLDDYKLENGLLNYEVISSNFKTLEAFIPEEDRVYYKSLLVDSYNSHKLPNGTIYYSDHVIKQHNSSTSKDSSLAYVKATEAGRAFASSDEAAFSHKFFLLTVVATLIVVIVGFLLILYI